MQWRFPAVWFVCCALCAGCGGTPSREFPVASPKPVRPAEPPRPSSPVAATASTPSTPTVTSEEEVFDVRTATTLAVEAEKAYIRGDYVSAEAKLKQAITIYPFLSRGYLLLGKVLLIRGSAEHDTGLLNNARLMFEMALAMDPALEEADRLLRLFSGNVGTEIGAPVARGRISTQP